MKAITLASGYDIPILGFGTWQLEDAQCETAVAKAIEVGYRHIDTAVMYKNHVAVGKGIKQAGVPREELFITSKVWVSPYDRAKTEQQIAAMLDEMDIPYVDLVLIHWPRKAGNIEDVFGAMEAAVDAGTIRSIGISNFTIPLVNDAAAKANKPIAVNQVEFHAHLYQKGLLDACREHNVALTAYSPLGRGEVLADPTLVAIAEAHGKSSAQVAIRWLIQHDIIVIPKASSEGHIRSNFEVFDFELTADEMTKIDAIQTVNRIIDPQIMEFPFDPVHK